MELADTSGEGLRRRRRVAPRHNARIPAACTHTKTMNDKSLSIAGIGCAGIARHAHLPAILRVPQYRFPGVTAPCQEIAARVAALSWHVPDFRLTHYSQWTAASQGDSRAVR